MDLLFGSAQGFGYSTSNATQSNSLRNLSADVLPTFTVMLAVRRAGAFQKMEGPLLGVLIIGIIVYWGRFGGRLFFETPT